MILYSNDVKCIRIALQQEVKDTCGEESSDSYQEIMDTLQQKIDSASE